MAPNFGLSERTHLFASYNYGFRAPSEGQLFRPSSATTAQQAAASARSALGLKPIVATQFEIGLRGDIGPASYSVAVYDLVKKDDIVSLRDNATNLTQSTNAGKTRHRGIEIGADTPLARSLSLAVAFSYARHTYENWVAFSSATSSNVDYSGKAVESAPRLLANTRLAWSPTDSAMLELEWIRLGSYWLDQPNTARYQGHNLFNLRGNWRLSRQLAVFASLYNLTDKRYADSASISSSTPVFSPGLPRVVYAGAELKW